MPAVPAPLQKWSVERSITAPAIINYRIATLVFWHVAFRRMRAEAKLECKLLATMRQLEMKVESCMFSRVRGEGTMVRTMKEKFHFI